MKPVGAKQCIRFRIWEGEHPEHGDVLRRVPSGRCYRVDTIAYKRTGDIRAIYCTVLAPNTPAPAGRPQFEIWAMSRRRGPALR